MGMQIVSQQQAIPALATDEKELAQVLQTSLYPGASMPSIKMVIDYCRATHLDPMQKPVHIVPMWDKNSKETRDVIMPGVGLYRTQAARTGEYAGMSEPEFGPDVTGRVGGVEMTYPKWCKVVVKRLLPNGMIVDFPAVEYWRENYATSRKDSEEPNAMWRKRPYGQISKCAEAQALRKAFPEIGSQPTAEEMEGKEYTTQEEPSISRSTSDTKTQDADPQLVADIRAEASKGLKAYEVAWTSLTKEQRRSLTKYHEENKNVAAAADKARTIDSTEAAVADGAENEAQK